MTTEGPDELPDGVDPELWLPCRHGSDGRDYLDPAIGHTEPGRIEAYCAPRRSTFTLGASEVPDDAPPATRYWTAGFVSGDLRRPVEAGVGWLTIRLETHDGTALRVMFEPLGHIYELASGESMSADVLTRNLDEKDVVDIVATSDVVAIWPPGHVQTRDADGNVLDWLN